MTSLQKQPADQQRKPEPESEWRQRWQARFEAEQKRAESNSKPLESGLPALCLEFWAQFPMTYTDDFFGTELECESNDKWDWFELRDPTRRISYMFMWLQQQVARDAKWDRVRQTWLQGEWVARYLRRGSGCSPVWNPVPLWNEPRQSLAGLRYLTEERFLRMCLYDLKDVHEAYTSGRLFDRYESKPALLVLEGIRTRIRTYFEDDAQRLFRRLILWMVASPDVFSHAGFWTDIRHRAEQALLVHHALVAPPSDTEDSKTLVLPLASSYFAQTMGQAASTLTSPTSDAEQWRSWVGWTRPQLGGLFLWYAIHEDLFRGRWSRPSASASSSSGSDPNTAQSSDARFARAIARAMTQSPLLPWDADAYLAIRPGERNATSASMETWWAYLDDLRQYLHVHIAPPAPSSSSSSSSKSDEKKGVKPLTAASRSPFAVWASAVFLPSACMPHGPRPMGTMPSNMSAAWITSVETGSFEPWTAYIRTTYKEAHASSKTRGLLERWGTLPPLAQKAIRLALEHLRDRNGSQTAKRALDEWKSVSASSPATIARPYRWLTQSKPKRDALSCFRCQTELDWSGRLMLDQGMDLDPDHDFLAMADHTVESLNLWEVQWESQNPSSESRLLYAVDLIKHGRVGVLLSEAQLGPTTWLHLRKAIYAACAPYERSDRLHLPPFARTYEGIYAVLNAYEMQLWDAPAGQTEAKYTPSKYWRQWLYVERIQRFLQDVQAYRDLWPEPYRFTMSAANLFQSLPEWHTLGKQLDDQMKRWSPGMVDLVKRTCRPLWTYTQLALGAMVKGSSIVKTVTSAYQTARQKARADATWSYRFFSYLFTRHPWLRHLVGGSESTMTLDQGVERKGDASDSTKEWLQQTYRSIPLHQLVTPEEQSNAVSRVVKDVLKGLAITEASRTLLMHFDMDQLVPEHVVEHLVTAGILTYVARRLESYVVDGYRWAKARKHAISAPATTTLSSVESVSQTVLTVAPQPVEQVQQWILDTKAALVRWTPMLRLLRAVPLQADETLQAVVESLWVQLMDDSYLDLRSSAAYEQLIRRLYQCHVLASADGSEAFQSYVWKLIQALFTERQLHDRMKALMEASEAQVWLAQQDETAADRLRAWLQSTGQGVFPMPASVWPQLVFPARPNPSEARIRSLVRMIRDLGTFDASANRLSTFAPITMRKLGHRHQQAPSAPPLSVVSSSSSSSSSSITSSTSRKRTYDAVSSDSPDPSPGPSNASLARDPVSNPKQALDDGVDSDAAAAAARASKRARVDSSLSV